MLWFQFLLSLNPDQALHKQLNIRLRIRIQSRNHNTSNWRPPTLSSTSRPGTRSSSRLASGWQFCRKLFVLKNSLKFHFDFVTCHNYVPILELFISVGNLEPKLKWFFNLTLKPKILHCIATQGEIQWKWRSGAFGGLSAREIWNYSNAASVTCERLNE